MLNMCPIIHRHLLQTCSDPNILTKSRWLTNIIILLVWRLGLRYWPEAAQTFGNVILARMNARRQRILRMSTSVEIFRIGYEGEKKPVILWIGVVPGTLTDRDWRPKQTGTSSRHLFKHQSSSGGR
jgi:hypothetical protein